MEARHGGRPAYRCRTLPPTTVQYQCCVPGAETQNAPLVCEGAVDLAKPLSVVPTRTLACAVSNSGDEGVLGIGDGAPAGMAMQARKKAAALIGNGVRGPSRIDFVPDDAAARDGLCTSVLEHVVRHLMEGFGQPIGSNAAETSVLNDGASEPLEEEVPGERILLGLGRRPNLASRGLVWSGGVLRRGFQRGDCSRQLSVTAPRALFDPSENARGSQLTPRAPRASEFEGAFEGKAPEVHGDDIVDLVARDHPTDVVDRGRGEG